MRFEGSVRRLVGSLGIVGAIAASAGAVDASSVVTAREGVINLRTGDVALAGLPDLMLQAGFGVDRVVLRLDGPMSRARAAVLAGVGVECCGYLPTNCCIANVRGTNPARVAATGMVLGAYAYQDQWKLDPVVAAAVGDVAINIWLFEGTAPDAAQAALGRIPALTVLEVERVGSGWRLLASCAAADAVGLSRLGDVQYVEPVPVYELRNNYTTRWTIQSGISTVFPLYDHGLTGTGQVIGVIDGGLGVSHCAFLDPVNPIGPAHRKIVAYNGTIAYDQHGTHVSDTAAGDGGSDTTNTRGVAYGARLAFGTYPSITEASVLSKHETHYNQGAFVGTNSWGSDSTRAYDGGCRAIDTFLHDHDDALVTHAASNGSIVTNPENAKNSLCVTASNNGAGMDQMCSGVGGSGPTQDGRRKPEVVAPGCAIASASGASGCGTTTLNGTSMATPAVGGLAVLVRQYYVNGFYPTGAAAGADGFSPSGPLVKATIVNGAQDMTSVAGYPSNREGWGRVLGDASLFFGGDTRSMVVREVRNAAAEALDTGDAYEFAVTNGSNTLPLRITMCYHDAPAQVNAALAPVNNLDLIVTAPDGSIYYGNMFAAGFSVPGGGSDALNNTEQVHIALPLAGQWSIRVVGTAVNAGPQGFAVVVSGIVGEGAPCAGDFNQDGGVDGLDIEAFFLAWGAGEDVADVNQDGGVDGGDVETFFAAWQNGC